MKNDEVEKVIVIGGGPAGLAASLYLGRSGFHPLVFAGSPSGGQLMLTSEVENFPGVESIMGPELIEKMRKNAQKFDVRIQDENIVQLNLSVRPFELKTINKLYQSTAILIATGAKAVWLGLESEARLKGRGVSACATCDGFFFRNKVVAVVGGGDTAMEEALTLTRFASKVFVIHRKDFFRASKIMSERVLKNNKIEVLWNEQVTEVMGQAKIEGVSLSSGRKLQVDGLFVAIGHKPDTAIFESQIEMDEKGYILTSGSIAGRLTQGEIEYTDELRDKLKTWLKLQSTTSVRGVFAGGDCVDYTYRQAGTASGMGIAAALDIEKYLTDQGQI